MNMTCPPYDQSVQIAALQQDSSMLCVTQMVSAIDTDKVAAALLMLYIPYRYEVVISELETLQCVGAAVSECTTR